MARSVISIDPGGSSAKSFFPPSTARRPRGGWPQRGGLLDTQACQIHRRQKRVRPAASLPKIHRLGGDTGGGVSEEIGHEGAAVFLVDADPRFGEHERRQ